LASAIMINAMTRSGGPLAGLIGPGTSCGKKHDFRQLSVQEFFKAEELMTPAFSFLDIQQRVWEYSLKDEANGGTWERCRVVGWTEIEQPASLGTGNEENNALRRSRTSADDTLVVIDEMDVEPERTMTHLRASISSVPVAERRPVMRLNLNPEDKTAPVFLSEQSLLFVTVETMHSTTRQDDDEPSHEEDSDEEDANLDPSVITTTGSQIVFDSGSAVTNRERQEVTARLESARELHFMQEMAKHEDAVHNFAPWPPEPVEPNTEPKAEPKAEPEAKLKAEPKAEPESEPKAEPKAEPQAELGADPIARAEPLATEESDYTDDWALSGPGAPPSRAACCVGISPSI